uniref:Uncharacterized protein n=1 Tax=Aegilops tauschii TaxID=37682 RepID=M8BHA7_AEGTA
MAEYHAAAWAVGGCAIYVSDKPENHDFDLLRKLVFPDGSILRAKLPGRQTGLPLSRKFPGALLLLTSSTVSGAMVLLEATTSSPESCE